MFLDFTKEDWYQDQVCLGICQVFHSVSLCKRYEKIFCDMFCFCLFVCFVVVAALASSGFGGRGVLPGVPTGAGISPKSSKVSLF